MGAITYDRIKVEGGFGLQKIEKLELHIEPNKHGKVYISGIVDKEIYEEYKGVSLQTHIIKIKILDEKGLLIDKPIFSGILKSVEYMEVSGIPKINIALYSGSIQLDREKKCRSFQDISLTYEEIIRKTIKGTDKANVLAEVGEDISPIKPIIQYMETDWAFCLRLASHFNSMLYPEVSQPYPRFYFGAPALYEEIEINPTQYTIGLSERYYELGGSEAGYEKIDFVYYEVVSYENYELNSKIIFAGKKWKIGKKSATIIRNELVFTYYLCREQLLSFRKSFNPLFTGMTIIGTVLSTKGNTLKLHLDIDSEQPEAKAYAYEWLPDTGSVMYCMPKVGTSVSLYFSSEDEYTGKAINCIRTNGGSCEATSDPNNKGLSTEHGKSMFLKPEAMGFSIEESGHHLKIEDDIAVSMESKKKIKITSGKATKLVGKTITIFTPTEMNLARK